MRLGYKGGRREGLGGPMNEDRKSGRGGGAKAGAKLTAAQSDYLSRGLAEPGGKLPLFDRNGQRYSRRTIQSCIDRGWARPWFQNPLKPDWLICKLTDEGRRILVAD